MKIRKRVFPSGHFTWQLDLGVINGKRAQKQYKSKAEAQQALEDHKVGRERFGSALVDLTPGQVAEVMLAIEKLRPLNVSILEAVEFFVKSGVCREPVTVRRLYEGFVDARERTASARYLRQLGVSLGSFVARFEERLSHTVTAEEVENWLEAGNWAPKTRNNYLGDVSAMMAWGKIKGYLAQNPCEQIRRARLTEGEIGTLTVPQCRLLLQAALAQPEYMGFIVLGLFGGLRPAEIERLDWSAVDVEAGTVVIRGSQAKTRARRVVDLSENARAWLRAAGVERQGLIAGKWWAARWRLFRRGLGWPIAARTDGLSRTARAKPDARPAVEATQPPWPHNALRHTFASMHYAHHQNEAALQVQMGHESAAMLHRHYRALKTKAEAAEFWALVPGVAKAAVQV